MRGNTDVIHQGSYNEFPFLFKSVHIGGRGPRLKQLYTERNLPGEVGRFNLLAHQDRCIADLVGLFNWSPKD